MRFFKSHKESVSPESASKLLTRTQAFNRKVKILELFGAQTQKERQEIDDIIQQFGSYIADFDEEDGSYEDDIYSDEAMDKSSWSTEDGYISEEWIAPPKPKTKEVMPPPSPPSLLVSNNNENVKASQNHVLNHEKFVKSPHIHVLDMVEHRVNMPPKMKMRANLASSEVIETPRSSTLTQLIPSMSLPRLCSGDILDIVVDSLHVNNKRNKPSKLQLRHVDAHKQKIDKDNVDSPNNVGRNYANKASDTPLPLPSIEKHLLPSPLRQRPNPLQDPCLKCHPLPHPPSPSNKSPIVSNQNKFFKARNRCEKWQLTCENGGFRLSPVSSPAPIMNANNALKVTEEMLGSSATPYQQRQHSPFSSQCKAVNSQSKSTIPTGIGCPRKWRVGKILGQGTFGMVHEGLNVEDGSFFAVKISKMDEFSPEIIQEIEVLSKLEHPNIVKYYGSSFDEDGRLCIFMELVGMGSLKSILSKYKQFEDHTIRSYTHQILLGLEYLHSQRTIHRDIKCANILVDAKGHVKLSDFGMAKQVGESLASSLKGTPLYMAPEVLMLKNNSYSFPADIWSLGCTVLEMVDGKPPWSDLQGFGFLFKVKEGKIPSIPEHLGYEGQDFIKQCLKTNPNDRPTATQLLQHPFVMNIPHLDETNNRSASTLPQTLLPRSQPHSPISSKFMMPKFIPTSPTLSPMSPHLTPAPFFSPPLH